MPYTKDQLNSLIENIVDRQIEVGTCKVSREQAKKILKDFVYGGDPTKAIHSFTPIS